MVTIGRRTRELAHAIRRMPRRLKALLALAGTLVAALAVAAVVAGGSGGVPRDAVATVDGEAIGKASFDHWVTVAASSGGKSKSQVPKPPDYTACVAAKRKAEPKPKAGQNPTPEAQLEAQCETEYRSLRDRALQLLISQRWIEGEADELGISVKDSEVNKAFEEQRKRSFPKDADYRKFLADSGQSEEDILMRVRVDLLSGRIRDRMTKGDDKVTDKQIATYYRVNRPRFAKPEVRDLRIVLARTKAKAEQARAELRGGTSWSSVVKRYSIDQTSRSKGGRLPAVAEGQQEKGLDEAAFEAAKGKLTGPVKTQFGYYVFEVTKVTPGSQQTLGQATPSIRQALVAERGQKRVEAFLEKFRDKWRQRTECRNGYEMADCRNAPKPTPTPGAGRQQQQPSR